MPENVAMTGVAGYIAPRHLKAIRDTGNRLVAAADPKDSVGTLDKFTFMAVRCSGKKGPMIEAPPVIHPSAFVDQPVHIGPGTRIWHFCHVMSGARIGRDCNIGQNVVIGGRVVIGDRVKIQNNVSVYDGVTLEDDVFCGPSCVFTNVVNPRSELSRRGQYAPTLVKRGATIGANATVVCGTTIGRYGFVAAGAVVPQMTVADYALMVGVPAVQRGWMSRHGARMCAPEQDGAYRCAESGWRYGEEATGLRCLDWPDDEPLPAALVAPRSVP